MATVPSTTMQNNNNNESTADLLIQSDSMEITKYRPGLIIIQDRSEKSSSTVWRHFGSLQSNDCVDLRHVYCIHCFKQEKIKRYQKSTSTSNLSKHLRKQHRITLEQTYVVKKDQSNVRVVKAEQNSDGTYHTQINAVNYFSDNLGGTLESDDPNVEEFLIHDINEILIQEVEKRPILYNPSLCQEKGQKHQIRRQLWHEIFVSLNHLIPYEKLPKTWKNIRDRYYKIKRNMEHNSVNDIEVRPKYRYYDLLRFLDHLPNERTDKQDGNCKSPNSTKSQNLDNYVDEFIMNHSHSEYITVDAVDISNDRDFDDDQMVIEAKRIKLSPDIPPSDSDSHYDDEPPHDADQYTTIISADREMEQERDRNWNGRQIILTPSHIIESIETTSTETQATAVSSELLIQPQLQSPHSEDANAIDMKNQNESQNDQQHDEFSKFGDFVAEVMRNMTKSQSRAFQMKIMGLIVECEENN